MATINNTNKNAFAQFAFAVTVGNKNVLVTPHTLAENAYEFTIKKGEQFGTLRIKSFMNALNALMNGTYKEIQGEWLFLKVTLDYVRTAGPIDEIGYAIGGADMVKAIEEGLIVRNEPVKMGETYLLRWDGLRVTTQHIAYPGRWTEGESEFVTHARNRTYHAGALAMIMRAMLNNKAFRLLWTEKEDYGKERMDQIAALFNEGKVDELAELRKESKINFAEKRAEKRASYLAANGDEARTEKYLEDGSEVLFLGAKEPVSAKESELIGHTFFLVYKKSSRPFQGGIQYTADEKNVRVLAIQARKMGLRFVEVAVEQTEA